MEIKDKELYKNITKNWGHNKNRINIYVSVVYVTDTQVILYLKYIG